MLCSFYKLRNYCKIFFKKIKQILKTRKNDYKKAYLRIEIEIIPKENEYGRFIHIPYMKGESNYHIYFKIKHYNISIKLGNNS